MLDDRVVVVTGAGGMGTAIARRIGAGSTLVLAEVNPTALQAVADELRAEGYQVVTHVTDVSDPSSVARLAEVAAAAGSVRTVVHTAGLSPVQASAEAILKVDLLGAAVMLDEFAKVIAKGGAGVFIASMAGTMAALDPDLEWRLANTPTGSLLELPELSPEALGEGGAYGVSKRANQVRIKAASLVWGARGARVNSISPGIIATPMGTSELDGASGDMMRGMIDASPAKRIGTPNDIAAAVAFLVSDAASFITGTDLLVDGGAVAAISTGPR